MFRQILVPLDGSPLSERALPYASALASSTGAGISLVHPIAVSHGGAVEGPTPWAGMAEAERYLAGIARTLAAAGTPAELAVPPGDAREVVLDALANTRPDLVVLPLPLHAGLAQWVGVAEAVLADSAQPTLLVPTWGATGEQADLVGEPRLVVPLDGSSRAEATLPFALALARHLGAAIVLLRVVSPSLVFTLAGAERHQRPDGLLIERGREAEHYLERIAAGLRLAGCAATTEVRIGWPTEEIAAATREYRAPLVLMATGWRAEGERPRLGGVARGVLRHGGAAVLLVRASAVPLARATTDYFAEASRAFAPAPSEVPPAPAWHDGTLRVPAPALAAARAPLAEPFGIGAAFARLREAVAPGRGLRPANAAT